MASKQRGMALVSVMLILSVLLVMAHILAEKIWQSSRQLAAGARREQLFWAAQAGIEEARRELAVRYGDSHGWQDFLVSGGAQGYQAPPAWITENDGITVEIFLRDNPDGDHDVRHDNDLKIFVLARARDSSGAEAMVESLCGYVPPAFSSSPAGGNFAAALSALPVRTYDIAD